MDESALTRKAIDELMKEMSDYKERESLPMERKINPLGKPNKRFLGRTINSMLTHNKRESDRNHQKCQRKLKELDAYQRKRNYYEGYRNHRKAHLSSHEVISSSSEDEKKKSKKSKKLKKKKKKKRKKQKKSSSSSSSSSSSTSSSSSSSDSDSGSSTNSSASNSRQKKWKHKSNIKEEYDEQYYGASLNDPGMSYYIDPNMAYAAMAYNQMQQMIQQQQMLQQQQVKEELEDNVEENVEILSDLDLSCPSESSLNISLHSSSAEEDENGVFTFKLSSDEDNEPTAKNNKSISNDKNDTHSNSDQESVQSHISLESDKSQQRKIPPVCVNEVSLLSSSSSDSELEIIESVENVNNKHTKTNGQLSENRDTVDEISDNLIQENRDIASKNVDLAETTNRESANKNIETSKDISMIDLTDD